MDGQWGAQMIDPLYVVARSALLDALDAIHLAEERKVYEAWQAKTVTT